MGNRFKFHWWDDAVAYAHRRAARTGWRHKVTKVGDVWVVRTW